MKPADADALSMEQVTTMLQCTEETVVSHIAAGTLNAVKFGRGWIFPREAFRESLNQLAREEAQRRRAERDAKGKASTVIDHAKQKPRRRAPPALPSLP